MYIFTYSYNIMRKYKKPKRNILGMQMSWWGGDKDDDSDSGVKIDWDAYNDLNSDNNTPEDRGVIEVPAGSESVIYQDEDGNYYEVDIGELEDYDDEGEIEHSKPSSKFGQIKAKSKKAKIARKPTIQSYRNQMRCNAFRSYVR